MDLPLMDILVDVYQKQHLPCFNKMFILGCCSICNHGNNIIFDGETISSELVSCYSRNIYLDYAEGQLCHFLVCHFSIISHDT